MGAPDGPPRRRPRRPRPRRGRRHRSSDTAPPPARPDPPVRARALRRPPLPHRHPRPARRPGRPRPALPVPRLPRRPVPLPRPPRPALVEGRRDLPVEPDPALRHGTTPSSTKADGRSAADDTLRSRSPRPVALPPTRHGYVGRDGALLAERLRRGQPPEPPHPRTTPPPDPPTHRPPATRRHHPALGSTGMRVSSRGRGRRTGSRPSSARWRAACCPSGRRRPRAESRGRPCGGPDGSGGSPGA